MQGEQKKIQAAIIISVAVGILTVGTSLFLMKKRAKDRQAAAALPKRLREAAFEGNTAEVERILASPFWAKYAEADYGPLVKLTAHFGTAQEIEKDGVGTFRDDIYGFQPLHLAVKYGQKEVAALLLLRGADREAKTNDGQTPLILAIEYCHREVAALLLHSGVDVNSRGSTGINPLSHASFDGNTEMAALLLQHGADANSTNESGRTPLISACWGGRHTDRAGTVIIVTGEDERRAQLVALLLKYGADPNVNDRDGKTALQWAEERGHGEVAALLRQHGASR